MVPCTAVVLRMSKTVSWPSSEGQSGYFLYDAVLHAAWRSCTLWRCPAGRAQDKAQQAADALKLQAAKESLKAGVSVAERTAVQDTDKVTALYRDNGDPVARPAAPAFARPPPSSQVQAHPYLKAPCDLLRCFATTSSVRLLEKKQV